MNLIKNTILKKKISVAPKEALESFKVLSYLCGR